MTLPLTERILAAIARATSQHPARADAVRSRTGADEAAFAAAIEQLAAGRRLNCAWIQQAGDAAPWLAIWPTGLPAKSAAWTGGSHSALFVTHRPNDLYQAHAPRSTPKTAPTPTPEPEPSAMKTPRKKSQRPDPIDADFAAIAEAVASMEPEPEPLPQPHYGAGDLRVTEIHDESPARIEFALWDDGRLSICDGDEIVLIPSDAVCRLALLLGVPGTTLPARPSTPPLPQLLGSPAVAGA